MTTLQMIGYIVLIIILFIPALFVAGLVCVILASILSKLSEFFLFLIKIFFRKND